jgi:Zn finger protein HypA/HybF involved in hydrogenase expression
MKYASDEFINKCKSMHGDLYDYSIVDYKYSKDKIKIICKKHGLFEQRAQAHMIGQGCKKCYDENRNPTQLQILNELRKVHGNLYSYDNIGFKSMKKKINIICKKHGEFTQMAFKHLSGQGCPKCARESHRISESSFINRSIVVHGGLYDYSLVSYINHSTKVIIKCRKHGNFNQTPNNHLIHKKGCPKCSKIISKMETEWLDSIDMEMDRQYKITIDGKKYIVDGYDPNTMTIYEFYGDYWHGNLDIYDSESYNTVSKKKFGDLYNKVLEREDLFIKSGYSIISIWESDFKKNKNENEY